MARQLLPHHSDFPVVVIAGCRSSFNDSRTRFKLTATRGQRAGSTLGMGLLTRREALLRAGGLAAVGLIPAANESAAASRPEPAQGRDVDHALQARVGAGQIPGVVAMAANERSVLYEGAFGRRNMASEERMSTDTIFRIASMVKPFDVGRGS